MISEKMKELVKGSSAIRAMFEEGKKLSKIYGHENVYDFSIGNPSVEPPKIVEDSIVDVLKNTTPVNIHGYTNNQGDEDVRQSIAQHINKLNNTSFTSDNFVLTAGAAAAMNIIFKTLLNPSDEVIVFAPFFGEYKGYVENHGGKVIVVSPDTKRFMPNLSEFKSKITYRTKAVIINTPNNPTGVVYSKDTIKELAIILEEKQRELGQPIYIISDEPYKEISYDNVEVPFIPNFYKNTLIAYSYSKALSLPGERIGYVHINNTIDDYEDIVSALTVSNRILGFVNAPSLFQKVLPYCLDAKVDINTYKKNRDTLYDMLIELGFECIKPEGAFYLFPKALIEDEIEFCNVAKEFRLLIVPGSSFGCPGHFRVAYCVSHNTIVNSYDSFKKLADKYLR